MKMVTRGAVLMLCSAAPSTPLAAQAVNVSATGLVTSIQSDQTGGISAGDPVALSFSFDPSQVGDASVLALGGAATVYDALLTNLRFRIGPYNHIAASVSGTLYYHDNVFGQDAFGFVFHDPVAGPFGSSFANIQLQFRAGSTDLLNGSGIGNGLPASGASADVFAIFGGDVYANVRATGVVVTVDAVPAPASWALMSLGFGAAGGALRCRRRRPATSCASELPPLTA